MDKSIRFLGKCILISTIIVCATLLLNSYVFRNKVYDEGKRIVDPLYKEHYILRQGGYEKLTN